MRKTELLDKYARDGDSRLLLARVLDQWQRAEQRGVPTHTGFLSPAEQAVSADLLMAAAPGQGILAGGYPDAERRLWAFLPDWLEEDRLAPYFSSVVLSSVCHLRKPGAEIYRIALRELGVEPGECVSVADNIKRDITGAKEAGIGCNVIFRSPEKKHPVVFTEENRPDAVISQFTELLDLLPALN